MFKTLLVGLPGFEPGQTGPESVVLPLYYSPMSITKSKGKPPLKVVGLPGFEPGQTGPESVVLPLYYSPMLCHLQWLRHRLSRNAVQR